ncbi:MAG: ABC transporter permease [Chloroflexi bacterium]|nr:ABC transporter permease [Chloroflexota bacterium]
MQAFLMRRVLMMIPTILGATLMVFLLMRVVPGDIVYARLAGEQGAASVDPASVAKLRTELGLDRPLLVQYLEWIAGIPLGDLGDSMWNRLPVGEEIWSRFPITVEIAFMAVAMGFVFGVPLGIISALKRGTWMDFASRVFAISFLAFPTFWLGLIILVITVRNFNWMPPLGYHAIWQEPLTNLKQLIFPSLVLASHQMAIVARMSRSTMLEVLGEDYIRTARAKGLAESMVVWRHVMKNSMIPVITIVSVAFGSLLAGAVVMEVVFSVPGVGSYLIQSITVRDYTATQAIVFLLALFFVVINLFVDISYGWLDPRIRRT